MARCGCTGTTCSCKITGEGGINVRGAGTVTNPYIISGGVGLVALDSATINHTLLGAGSTTDPYVLTSEVTMGLGDLQDVEISGGTAGDVVALQGDGTFALAAPSTAPVGAISTGTSLDGDGSGGDPLVVRLAALAGLEIVSGGLRLDPYTVTTEGDLDPTFGALPSGSIVSDTDGLNAWLKSDSGWKALIEDSGTITTVGGNVVAEAGWSVDTLQVRRRNGIVQLRLTVHSTVSRTTGFASGDIGNLDICTLVPAEMRPVLNAPLRIMADGPDHSFYITTGGVVRLTNMAQPDVVWAAGDSWTFAGTYIGA